MATDMAIDDQEEKERMSQTYAALGIGLVCVLVGVPLWWKTTEIYRVQLPYADIEHLSHIKTQYSVSIEMISLDSKLTDKLPAVARSLQETLSQKKSSVQCKYQVVARDADEKERNLWKQAKTLEDLDAAFGDQAKLRTSQYRVVLLPPLAHIQAQTAYLGRHGVLAFTVSEAGVDGVVGQLAPIIQEVLVREGAVDKSLDAAQGLRTQKPDKESMRWFRSKPGYDVTFTLINPQPDTLSVDWDIQAAVQEYLKPFMNKLADFTTISVTSQVLHYVGLVARPRKDSAQNVSYYTQKDLPHLINPLEAKLGSHASDRPSLNFVVYVPVRSNSPLYIRDENGSPVPSNAFLSPRWGGIVIYNTDVRGSKTDIPTVTVDMKPVMEVFLTQLRLLLNIHVQTSNLKLQMSDLGKEALTDWELSGWLRCRCVENLATAKASLTSLAQLLDHISNIVINDDIGTQVETAVASIQDSEDLLSSGRLYDAFLASRTAIIASEKAFFDQSLLELLYFPEDQKFAIYIPLFLPISIPVITSLMGVLRWLRQRRKEKKLREEQKVKEQ